MKWINDSGVELEVDYTVKILSHNSLEIRELRAWKWEDRNDSSAPDITLTDAELERFEAELYMLPETWEYDDESYNED